MEGLEDVRRDLVSKREEITRELQVARDAVSKLEGDRQKIDDALGALSGKKGKSRSRVKKHAPTLTEVQEVVAGIQVEHPFANGEKMEEKVRARIKKNGFSLVGFPALYEQAIKEEPAETPPEPPGPFLMPPEGFRQTG